MKPPSKSSTPYGGRLTFEMPAGNLLVVHLKDNAKIRNKKRWSQVMYMYYLLGYKYFADFHIMEKLYAADTSRQAKSKTNEFIGFGNLLNNIDPILRQKVGSHISFRKISFQFQKFSSCSLRIHLY